MNPATTDTDRLTFNAAHRAWQRCADMRNARRRFKNYTYGRQWDDPVTDPITKRTVTEGQLVADSGCRPLTNNLIRQLVKTVIGRYRALRAEQHPIPDNPAFDQIAAFNRLDELDCRMLEEFLISGCAIQYVCRECRPTHPRAFHTFVDNVNPAQFFINRVSDTRGWDIELVGRLLDISIPEVIMRFADSNPQKAAELRRIFMEQSETDARLNLSQPAEPSFLTSPSGRCRVIEVWTLETHEALRIHNTATGTFAEATTTQNHDGDNDPSTRRLWTLVPQWHCRYFAPDGTLIAHHTAPDHPFVVKLYPLVDGEIHPFVEDIIDQQRHVNRLITAIDTLMAASAKGVLLFPIESRVEGLDWADYSRRWSMVGGIIPYKARGGDTPVQVTATGTDAGATQLLQLQLSMIKDVSGVSDALMGHTPSAQTGAARYESEVRNATIALLDILETFGDFVSARNAKIGAYQP